MDNRVVMQQIGTLIDLMDSSGVISKVDRVGVNGLYEY